MNNSLQVKRYIADNIQTALSMVKKELGVDAVILSNETIDGKVHVIAAPEGSAQVENSQAQHAAKTASALTRLKQQKKENSLNPHFYNPASELDKRFSKVAMQSPPAAKANVQVDDVAIVKLGEEVSSIKKMMNAHFLSQHWAQFQQDNIIQGILYKKLIAIGFEPTTIEPYINKLSQDISFDEAWISVLNDMVKEISLFKPIKQSKSINCLIGPSGGGKTTLLAKYLMGQSQELQAHRTALIFVSQDKLTTVHESKAFKNVFNVPSFYVETVEELEKALVICEDKEQIFIDLPAPNLLDKEQNIYINYLNQTTTACAAYYVLPSFTDLQYVRQCQELLQGMTIAAMSITKIDEHANYIPLLNVALQCKIPIAFLNLSASMTEPLMFAQATSLIKDMLIVINQFSLDNISVDEKMAKYFMEKMDNATQQNKQLSA